MSRVKFISIPFKIDGSQTGGFKTVDGMAKISHKDGRIILQISKDDRSRAERFVRILQTPVSRLFGDEDDTKEIGNGWFV
ncbi:MAG: hypothetical protein WKF71_12475 [Pyrinomonadaceae bacterium]